uniref:Putative ovule protein n=1 Tax=Solanum chacoense TaxID=4108 RepID=A0A0V0GLE0_SOLCH
MNESNSIFLMPLSATEFLRAPLKSIALFLISSPSLDAINFSTAACTMPRVTTSCLRVHSLTTKPTFKIFVTNTVFRG